MTSRPYVVEAEALSMSALHDGHKMGAIPGLPDPRDYRAAALMAAQPSGPLPKSASLADYLPPVWNQDPYGSCTAFMANTQVAIIRAKQGLAYFEPSWMATWYWTKLAEYGANGALRDVGCSIRDAVLSTVKHGVAPASLFPYNRQTFQQVPGPEVEQDAELNQTLAYFRIDHDNDKQIDMDLVHRSLADGFPVGFGVPIHESFRPDPKTGLIPYPKDSDKILGYHAMTIFGYRADRKSGYEKVRNQWGQWGGVHDASGKVKLPGCCRMTTEHIRDFAWDLWTVRQVEDGKIVGTDLYLDEVIR